MSEILRIAHDMAKAIHKRGGMSDVTMREMETLCQPQPVRITPATPAPRTRR